MSHFAVIVVGDNVEKQLAPYHEFECTGVDDQYVIDVDVTDEALEKLDSKVDAVKWNGKIYDYYDDNFWVEVAQDDEIMKAFRQKKTKFVLPDGAEQIEITRRELLSHTGETPEAWAEEYGGWKKKGDKFYDHTNPNAKWDWYEIGGRWTGWLKLKKGAKGEIGRPGLMTDPAKPGTADIMRKGDIDFAGMMDEAGREAGSKWDRAKEITQESWLSWDESREKFVHDIGAARDFYHAQPAIKALKESGDQAFSWEIDCDLNGTREDYVERGRNKAFVPYAILMDSEWIAKGDMGWFGCSSDKVDPKDWAKKVADLLHSLPDETIITVVDCHI